LSLGYLFLGYGVATISRLLQIINLFCRISSLLQDSVAKETYVFNIPVVANCLSAICFSAMGWLRLVGSLKWYFFFAEHRLLCSVLLQKRPMVLESLPTVATSYFFLGCLATVLMPRYFDSHLHKKSAWWSVDHSQKSARQSFRVIIWPKMPYLCRSCFAKRAL